MAFEAIKQTLVLNFRPRDLFNAETSKQEFVLLLREHYFPKEEYFG